MTRLADNYAAAFMYIYNVTEHKKEISDTLSHLSELIKSSRLLLNKHTPMKYKKSAIASFLSQYKSNELVSKLIISILEHNRLYIVPDVLESYKEKVLRSMNEKILHIESADEISQKEIEIIKSALSKKFGCSFLETITINKDIIGGLVLKFGSFVIDASEKARIESTVKKLKEQANKVLVATE